MRLCGSMRARRARRAVEIRSTRLRAFFQREEALSFVSQSGSVRFRSAAVDAKYSTAPSRLSQHLFFRRQHHARPQQTGRRLVDGDGDERAPFVEDAYVRAVHGRERGGDGRAVPDAARLPCR